MPSDDYFETWTTANPVEEKKKDGESDPSIEDGVHRCRIVGFRCFESKKGDVWMVFEFAVMGGLFDGRTLVRMVAPLGRRTDDTARRETQANWARRDLQTVLGRVPQLFPELLNPDTMMTGTVASEIVGAVVNVEKETKKGDSRDFINVYLVELVSNTATAAAPEDSAPPEPPPADDLPPLPDSPSRGSGMIDPDELDEIPF